MKLFLLALLLLPFTARADGNTPRLIVHLLDYIALDYSGAVEGGKILSQLEYDEMIEFSNKVLEGAKGLDKSLIDPELVLNLEKLSALVKNKASADEVARTARQAQGTLLKTARISVSPKAWPDLQEGAKIFAQSCVQCHGADGRGDGPSGKGLDPKPTDFHSERMLDVSPFQAFNAIRLGVPGTGMASWDQLSDSQVWSLAFYVVSLRYGPFQMGSSPLSLEEAASKTDRTLMATLAPEGLTAVRTFSQNTGGGAGFILVAKDNLVRAAEAARNGDFDGANRFAVSAYLDGVEPIEPSLRSKDAGLVARLETAMFKVRQSIGEKASAATVAADVAKAEIVLREAEDALGRETASPTFTFLAAAGIFLREGFEAILIIVTLLGIIRAIGSRRAARYVHGGWISAVTLGTVLWFFSGWVMAISGVSREVMEGAIALFAVAVLLYFGFWLHRRVQIQRWKEFLEQMTRTALEGRKLFALAVVAFMAVFRECFETILFLRALSLEPGASHFAMWGGVGVSLVVILGSAVALVRFSVRVPVRQLFALSSVVVWILAFVLTGKAVHSFQESGLLTMTGTPWTMTVDWVGFFPTYETFLAQLFVLVAGFVLYWVGSRPPKAQPVAVANR